MPYYYGSGTGSFPWDEAVPPVRPAAPRRFAPEAAPRQQTSPSPVVSDPPPLELAAATALLEGVGEAVLVTSGSGVVEAVHGEVERLWGYPRQRILGKKLSLLISNEARECSSDAGGAVRRLRVDAYRQDGTTFPAEVRIRRCQGGNPPRFLVAVRDLSELVAAEEKLRSLEKALVTMQAGVCVTDLDHRIVYANPAQAQMHGYTVEELTGRDARTLNPEVFSLSYEALSGRRTFRCESYNLRKDGSLFAVELVCDVVAGSRGAPRGMVTICQDITERKRAEEALRESEERYALAVRGANDGIWDWDLRSGSIYFSPRWKEMLGYPDKEIGDTPEAWFSRVHPQDAASLQRDLSAYLSGETRHFESRHRMLHRNGTYRWTLSRGTALRDAEGRALRLAGSQTDITDRAVQDALTELPTRTVFMDRLGAALERAHRGGGRCAVLFIDLDRFKEINDTLGHDAGDRLLITVARRVESCLGVMDTAARLGGDEFAVLIDLSGGGDRAAELVQRIERELARPVLLKDRERGIEASLGLAYSSPAHSRPEELLRDADAAMYRAKARTGAGRPRPAPPLRTRTAVHLKLEDDLKRALGRGELSLVYQPIVALSTASVAGFEALLRWQHPEQGLVLPADFVPFAERSGLIEPLGEWALHQACRQLRRWEESLGALPGLSVSVNVSARQLAQASFPSQVESALAAAGLDPKRLKLEITETALAEDPEAAAALLGELRARGIDICLDDFGTGYSSLSTLQSLPVDLLKIDRSFFAAPAHGHGNGHGNGNGLIPAVLKLARDLGLEVVAEGVETKEQAANLRRLRCSYIQGYWFSRPLEPEDAAERLAAERALTA